jgi:hypothetical protein
MQAFVVLLGHLVLACDTMQAAEDPVQKKTCRLTYGDDFHPRPDLVISIYQWSRSDNRAEIIASLDLTGMTGASNPVIMIELDHAGKKPSPQVTVRVEYDQDGKKATKESPTGTVTYPGGRMPDIWWSSALITRNDDSGVLQSVGGHQVSEVSTAQQSNAWILFWKLEGRPGEGK